MTSAREQLHKLAADRILVFDGGYGTAIQNYKLSEDDYRGDLDLTDDQKGKINAQIPAGRMGTPEEIAAAVLYLSSPEAGYVTGTTLHVNGGMAML